MSDKASLWEGSGVDINFDYSNYFLFKVIAGNACRRYQEPIHLGDCSFNLLTTQCKLVLSLCHMLYCVYRSSIYCTGWKLAEYTKLTRLIEVCFFAIADFYVCMFVVCSK